jgi:cysteine synthase
MLKFFNFLGLDISSIMNEFQLGLQVNFMHTEEVKRLMEKLGGKVQMVGKDPWMMPAFRRMLLLKEHGSVTLTYQLNNKNLLKHN